MMERVTGKAGRLILLAVCMLLLAAGMPVRASEEMPVSGTCGADITWKYEPVMIDGRECNRLVLTGSGAMTNDFLEKVTYEEGGTWHWEARPPWWGSPLYGITLDERITTIGDGAFGQTWLYDSNQEGASGEEYGTLVVPENVTSIGKLAFANSYIATIYIGPKVTKVGEQAFFDCRLKDLYVASTTLDFSQAPLVFDASTLEVIHAPKGSKAEAYAKAHDFGYEEWDGTDYGKTGYILTLDAGEGTFPEEGGSTRYTVSEDRKTAVREVSISAASVPEPDIAPVLAGKYFGGWYAGDKPFDFGVPMKQDTTVTAKWLESPEKPALTIRNDADSQVKLFWDIRADADLKGYRVYRADTAGTEFAKITENDLSAGSVSYMDYIEQKDIPKKQAYRYRIEAVYETNGTEKTVESDIVSCSGMIYNANLIEKTGGVYVGVKLVDKDGQEISSLTLHEGETSGELFFMLVKRDGTTVPWQDAMPDFEGNASIQCGLGMPYPAKFPLDNYSVDEGPFVYAKIPTGYLYDASCTRLKGLKTTSGQELYLYLEGEPGFLTAVPITVEAAEEGVTYPSYDDKEGIVTDDLQAGLQILRDAVRDRTGYGTVYIKKSACDPSIEAYNAFRAQDKSDNPSGDPRGGFIPDWLHAELYDINAYRPGTKPWEGDYGFYALRQDESYADLDNPVSIYGEAYYKLVLRVPQFTTTLEQEAAVDAKVEELLNGRLAGVQGKSEYARAKAVYDYVSSSMRYNNDDPVYHYAYGGLCQGKATCMGFAVSFQRLAAALGLESKVLMGMDSGAHTYNLVKIQGKYYYLDCSAKVFLKGKSFKHAPLQDRYLSTAFQTYYMTQISDSDYEPGENSAVGSIGIRALTNPEINAASAGAYTAIADRTMAKYTINDTVIEVVPYDKEHSLRPVYNAEKDRADYMLAFRLQVDQEKLDENGRIQIIAGGSSAEFDKKKNPTLRGGYLDVLLPLTGENVSIVIDYDTEEESASRYEAVTYTMDFSNLVKESVRLSGTVKERTDGVEETGIELSGPVISYRENDQNVTALYDAVAYSPAVRTENTGVTDQAGNYAALRISAPEMMVGTKALSESAAESADCTLRWEPNKKYLDCFCRMEQGKDKIVTIKWAGKETRTQTVTLRASQDCYMETDGADKDAAKKVAFNGLPGTIYVGQSQTADVKVTKAYEKDRVQLSFTSDDSDVLSVNRVTGEMKALRPGKVTLTVRAAGLDRKGKIVSASKKITVKQVPAPSGVKITEVTDTSAAATWKKNTNSQWTEGYAVPFDYSFGSNAKAWKAVVEKALTEAGLDSGMPENMTDEERQALENSLSAALCPGGKGKVVTADARTVDGSLVWESGLRTNTAYVFYLRNMTESAAGEISYTGWMSGKITTKMPVLTAIRLTAYNASGTAAAFNDQENSGYIYTDPTDDMIPAEVRYDLAAADPWQNDKDVYKNPSYKSTNAKVVKVDNKGRLGLGGQAGTAEIYVTGRDSTGKVRESDRIRITVVKSLQTIKDKTTVLTLGQSVSIQELVGCDVAGSVEAFQMDRVDLAALADELETAGKDCLKVTYPAGEKEKAVITPFDYPVDTNSGERKKGAGLTVSVKLYDKAGEGKRLMDTKNAVIKVNDMPAPAVSKVTALDTSVDITFRPNAVVQEIDGAQYYYTLILTNKNTGETKTYRAGDAPAQGSVAGDIFTYIMETDKKGKVSYRCRISGLTSETGYEAVVTAHYLAEPAGEGTKAALEAQKDSGAKKFTTLKPVIAAENSMKVSLVSMSELWADANAPGMEITHDQTVALTNGETYVLFADIGDYERILGADRIKWSVTSDTKGAAAVKASSDSYTANLTLSRCGTVRVQAVSTLSKKVVCSFTVEVKPYQSGTAIAGGETDETE